MYGLLYTHTIFNMSDCLDQIRYLTGYAGGIEKKEKLLKFEKKNEV